MPYCRLTILQTHTCQPLGKSHGGESMKTTIFNAFLSKATHTESHDNFYEGDALKFYI